MTARTPNNVKQKDRIRGRPKTLPPSIINTVTITTMTIIRGTFLPLPSGRTACCPTLRP